MKHAQHKVWQSDGGRGGHGGGGFGRGGRGKGRVMNEWRGLKKALR